MTRAPPFRDSAEASTIACSSLSTLTVTLLLAVRDTPEACDVMLAM